MPTEKWKLKSVIVFTLSFIFSLAVVFYLSPHMLNDIRSYLLARGKQKTSITTETSVFEDIAKKDTSSVVTENISAAEDFETYIENDFRILDSESWDWKKTYILAYINEKNVSERTLKITISFPVNFPGGNEKYVEVFCNKDNTASFTSVTFNKISDKVDFFNEVVPTGMIAAYCLDSECNSIGKSCIIIKDVSSTQEGF